MYMSNFKKIGLITSGKIAHPARSISAVLAQYPQAEIVSDAQEIMADSDISLVFVSAQPGEPLPVVGEALRSGKHVRIL